MPHVLVAGRIHDSGLDFLQAVPDFTFDLIEEITLAGYEPHIHKADALLLRTQPLQADTIEKAIRLKIVSRHGVGYDAVDVAALSARNITLAIVGDVNSRAVAEHTLMLMLSAARKTVAHDAAVRTGNWNVRNSFSTVELDGKKLFLIGFGRIGKNVAKLAQAFGMRVFAYDPYVSADAMTELGVAFVPEIADGISGADFVSLHIPAMGGSAVIGAAELAQMKSCAILINAARGGLIDELALDAALRNGEVAAAAIDVFVDEPPSASHPLLCNSKVVVSPHSAGLTQECAARMSVAAVQNIINYFNGTLDAKQVVNAAQLG